MVVYFDGGERLGTAVFSSVFQVPLRGAWWIFVECSTNQIGVCPVM